MANWQELDFSIYHKKLELSKLDSFIKNKQLKRSDAQLEVNLH